MKSVTVRTPAKINLALVVGPLRPDGFHDLASVYHAVELFDEVTVRRTSGRGITVRAGGEDADRVPTDETNLAVRAAIVLANRHGVSRAVRGGIAIDVHKGIPVAGGLAGGSSDAAATLLACDALWELGLSREEHLAAAAELGSDVPFCVLGGTVLGSGHGEVVTPVLARGRYWWVLATSTDGLSTPGVYAELDRGRAGALVLPPQVPEPLLSGLSTGNVAALADALTNDLQDPAIRLRPGLRRLLDAGLELGALGGLVSGSGPTCYFPVADADAAAEIAAKLADARLCDGVRVVRGPMPGARIIDSQ